MMAKGKFRLTGAAATTSRFLVRPYALARSRWDYPFAGLCILLLLGLAVAEDLTPDDVVGAFGLVPLLAAAWLLSTRPLSLVGAVGFTFLVVAISRESRNRPTVVLVGLAISLVVTVTRLYATSLARLLSSRHYLRPATPTQAAPWTLDRVDQVSHGVGSLTSRELQVARLAAQGYTVDDIGIQLHIVDRTVESHLASAYSKLRIHSRPELMRMLSSLVQ
jgi:DNA-binding CsgD family transcriptional regulator